MTLAVYPPELNQRFLVSGFRTSRVDRRIEAQGSRGRPWGRKGSSKTGGRPITGAIMEPIGNVARFWRFWEEELQEGFLPFKAWDPQLYGQPVSDQDGNPLADQDGNPLVMARYCLCQFVTVADETPLDDPLWQLAYQLRVLA